MAARSLVHGLATAAAAFSLAACEINPPGNDALDGECTAKVRYDGVLYQAHSELNQDAPAGRRVGTGEIVGCGDVDSAVKVAEVEVFTVRGVDSSLALWAGKDYQGIYVAKGLPQKAWPDVLLDPMR